MSATGDRRRAFEQLFAAHYRTVRGYVVRRSRSASVEDVLADTFLVAWRRLDSVPDDALPWLLGTARRVMANQRRAQRRRDALTTSTRSRSPGERSRSSPKTQAGTESRSAPRGRAALQTRPSSISSMSASSAGRAAGFSVR
jgi:RNA polymerase sigma-70 factor (ECF subfamily)